MRRFECTEGTSSKFWEGAVEAAALTVRFGRIGTQGQTKTKSFPDAKKAQAELDKLVREKLAGGYVEIAVAQVAAKEPAADADAQAEVAAVDAGEPSVAAKVPAKPAKPAKAAAPPKGDDEPGWIDAENGYRLALDAQKPGKILCKNPKGQRLASVPKEVKGGVAYAELDALAEWLEAHQAACVDAVETWMMRSLPTPRAVIAAVWEDEAWRRALRDAVIAAPDDDGGIDARTLGLLRGVDPAKGIGVVNLDGETAWLDVAEILVPHPILIAELDDLRGLVAELGATQGIRQLFRETFAKPIDLDPKARAIGAFRGGKFVQLQHALGVCRKHGFQVRGGSAICRVLRGGAVQEARFWIGADDPTVEAWTEDLGWVDDRERPILLGDVDAVAFSEGMRMASTIYGARAVEQQGAAS